MRRFVVVGGREVAVVKRRVAVVRRPEYGSTGTRIRIDSGMVILRSCTDHAAFASLTLPPFLTSKYPLSFFVL